MSKTTGRHQGHDTFVVSSSDFHIPDHVNHFYYQDGDWGFSVYEIKHHRQIYWYAHKRIRGHLYKFYLSKRDAITSRLLKKMSWAFKGILIDGMTNREFAIWDKAEFDKGSEIVTDPEEIAEFDAWMKETGFDKLEAAHGQGQN